jgi:hypothetical protein
MTVKNIYVLIVALIMMSGQTVKAHEDFYAIKEFGNVKVRIKTGFEYEEIYNIALLGQSAEKLCIALNYSKPILLDFIHCYINNFVPDYHVSYDKILDEHIDHYVQQRKSTFLKDYKITYILAGNYIDDNAIIVRQTAKHFECQTTLKLLEYAILNLNNINAIDTFDLNEALNSPTSDLVNNTMENKIYRSEDNFSHGVSYYMQKNRYFVFFSFMSSGGILFDIEHIFDFQRTGNAGNWVVIFDSDSSFYYAGGLNGLSKRHVLKKSGNYRPFNITYIGNHKIAIYYWYWKREREEDEVGDYFTVGDKEKTMIYIPKEDRIIEDLDKLLKQP